MSMKPRHAAAFALVALSDCGLHPGVAQRHDHFREVVGFNEYYRPVAKDAATVSRVDARFDKNGECSPND
jgi:hypothetical protein